MKLKNKIFLYSIFFVGIAAASAYALSPYITYSTKVITVDDKYIKQYDGEDKYIIVDTEGNAYQNADTYYFLKFNSTDVYNSLTRGKTFEIGYYGWRFPLLSWYPNIVNVERKD